MTKAYTIPEDDWAKAMSQQCQKDKKRKYKTRHGNELIPELRGKSACIVKDNGNGFTIKFPSYRSCDMDVFMSLDYSQAAYLRECLNQWKDD